MFCRLNSESCYFFTATILKWIPILADDFLKDIVINSFRFFVKEKNVKIYAFVTMPNHIHVIWDIQEFNKLSSVKRDFLKFTAQAIKRCLVEQKNSNELLKFNSRLKDRSLQIWQTRSLSVLMYSDSIIQQKIDYIHHNPLQQHWRLVNDPEKYKYSSASNYGVHQNNWEFVTNYFDH